MVTFNSKMIALRMMRKRSNVRLAARPPSGFVLVLVLAMLALITFTSARLALVSSRRALLAVAAEKSMRRQWATVSIRRLAFDQAGKWFNDPDGFNSNGQSDYRSAGEAQYDFNVQLGKDRYFIRVADESAKLPIGELLSEFQADALFTVANELLPPGFRFRTLAAGEPGVLLHDFGQAVEPSGRLNMKPYEINMLIGDKLSLWGPGRMSLHRTDPETVDALWRILVQRPAPSNLHRLLKDGASSNALDQLALRESQLTLLRRWIAVDSQHYSVWVVPQSDGNHSASFCVSWGRGTRSNQRTVEY